MYIIEAARIRKQDHQAIRELVINISKSTGLDCDLKTPDEWTHVCIRRPYDTEEAAQQSAALLKEKSQVNPKILRLS